MAEYYDEEGNPVEALSAEEAEAKAKEAADKAKADTEAELTEKLKKTEEELEKLRDKDHNFENLRKKTDTKEKEEDELTKKIAELEGKIEEARGSGTKVFLDSVKDKAIKLLAGTDAELEKKIRSEYEILNLPGENEDQINDRVRRAYLLAAEGNVNHDTLRGSMVPPQGSGRAVGSTKEGDLPSEEVRTMGARNFGLTDEDFKKFGGAKTTKA